MREEGIPGICGLLRGAELGSKKTIIIMRSWEDTTSFSDLLGLDALCLQRWGALCWLRVISVPLMSFRTRHPLFCFGL